jgi:hypothetical protein
MSAEDDSSKRPAQATIATGAAVLLVSLSSLSYFKAMAATATLPILSKIIRAIEITINTSMDFGTLAMTNDVAGQATIDPLSGQLRIDGKGGLALAGGAPRAGRVQVKGAPMAVNVSVEANNVQLTNGSTFLTVNNFNFLTANGGPQVTVTPTGPGDGIILSVGASIQTRPGQLTGTYTGSNRIFANYQ